MTPFEGHLSDQLSSNDSSNVWTQRELNTLRRMVREYEMAKAMRKRIGWWILWVGGLPAALLYFWEPLEKLIKIIRGGH